MRWSAGPVIIGQSFEVKRKLAGLPGIAANISRELNSRGPIAQSDQLKLVRGKRVMGHRRCLQEEIGRRWI
jgi:hypothetical protein